MKVKDLRNIIQQHEDDEEVYLSEKYQLEIGRAEVVDGVEKFILIRKINVNND